MSRCTALVFSCLLAACASNQPTGPTGPVMFPPPPDPPRLLFLRGVSSGEDVEPRESSWLANVVIGEQAVDEKPMGKPCAIAMRDGIFYVTDTEMQCIYNLDFANKKASQVELQGRAQVMSPQGLCFAPDGRIYVADRGRRQVLVLDDKFGWLAEYGPWEKDSGPTDVTIWKDRLYVVDSGSHCVRVLEAATGKELQILGRAENRDEFTKGPTNIAVDDNGFAYLVDTVYSRIYVWDADGKFVRHVGKPGDVPGHLARPKGITWFGNMLWVLDSAFDNCQIFDVNGQPLLFFGGRTDAPGGMSFPRKVYVVKGGLELFPDELAKVADFVPEALVVVTCMWGSKVNFYALGRSKKFKYEDVALPEQPTTPAPEPETPAGDAAKKQE